MGYLCYYLRNNKCEDIEDLTDEDIKEIIMPVDFNRTLLSNINMNTFYAGNDRQNYTKTHYFLPQTNPLYE